MNFVLEIAFKYLHPEQNEFEPYLALSQPFIAFSGARDNGFALEDILDSQLLKDAEDYFANSDLDLLVKLIFLGDVNFLNDSLNSLQFTAPKTCQVITYWFCDSFVKFYNDRPSPLQFPTKAQTRKEAMRYGNQVVLSLSGEKCRIHNFPSHQNQYD